MGIFKGKEIFTVKPWLTDYKQNVEQLKKILGLSSDNILPAIEEGDEGKVVGVSSGKYALVEGSGGSSDFSTAEVAVTFSVQPLSSVGATLPCYFDYGDQSATFGQISSLSSGSETINAILYKGMAVMYPNNSFVLNETGSIEYSEEYNCYLITGDCSFTLSDTE